MSQGQEVLGGANAVRPAKLMRSLGALRDRSAVTVFFLCSSAVWVAAMLSAAKERVVWFWMVYPLYLVVLALLRFAAEVVSTFQ